MRPGTRFLAPVVAGSPIALKLGKHSNHNPSAQLVLLRAEENHEQHLLHYWRDRCCVIYSRVSRITLDFRNVQFLSLIFLFSPRLLLGLGREPLA